MFIVLVLPCFLLHRLRLLPQPLHPFCSRCTLCDKTNISHYTRLDKFTYLSFQISQLLDVVGFTYSYGKISLHSRQEKFHFSLLYRDLCCSWPRLTTLEREEYYIGLPHTEESHSQDLSLSITTFTYSTYISYYTRLDKFTYLCFTIFQLLGVDWFAFCSRVYLQCRKDDRKISLHSTQKKFQFFLLYCDLCCSWPRSTTELEHEEQEQEEYNMRLSHPCLRIHCSYPWLFILTPCSTHFVLCAVRCYVSYHPISVVQRSKVLNLPPDQCCILSEATIHCSLYVCTTTFSHLTLLTLTCVLVHLHLHQKAVQYISTSSKYMFYFITSCNCTSRMYSKATPN